MNRSISVLCTIVLALSIAGCATKVIRTDVGKPTDFGGGWNDTDVRLVAEEMIKDALAGSWINDFNKTAGRTPTVIVGSIKNRTFEHISSETFINDLERALISSGKVTFVADKSFREEIRAEREDQLAGNTEPSTIAAKGHETGADFMLQGSINSIKDEVKGKLAVFYQVTLELVDMNTNQKRWVGQKEIKKVVLRPSAKL
jgi:penicillin-binding protein activator